jgi:solute:Na+ symporter, SSS family
MYLRFFIRLEVSGLKLTWLDWAVIALYFIFNICIGLYYKARASKNVGEFFLGGRNVPWWLAGTSMVATTFAADTPLLVAGLVANYGIAGNWLWWNFVAGTMLTVFLYARLWRRSGVMTDIEFSEIRYAGKPAAILRGFRAVYLGIPVNCIILGWVNLAMVKILSATMGVDRTTALIMVIGLIVFTSFISTLSGLWGVLVTDCFQFVIKMAMIIVLAVAAVAACGGMQAMKAKLLLIDAQRAASTGASSAGSVLDFVPQIGSAWMPLITFLVYISVQWWATWYPGAEPGGGGYIAQRMLSAKDEKHSLLATLWFAIAHYALRPWPWIITGLAAMILFPNITDKESGYILVMVNYLPPYFRGLMLAGFAAAYMSTIATQLNWGASYLVNDFYRRFFVKTASDKHYVYISQGVTVLLTVLSIIVTSHMQTIASAMQFLIAVGAGTGSVLLLRWYWWRVNAWSEISAMAASFVSSLALQGLAPRIEQAFGVHLAAQVEWAWVLIGTVAFTTATWLIVTFITGPEPNQTLIAFYRQTRPSAGWGPIARLAPDVKPTQDGMANIACWIVGCVMIYCTLFGLGKVIFEEYLVGFSTLAVAILAGWFIFHDLTRRGWSSLVE